MQNQVTIKPRPNDRVVVTIHDKNGRVRLIHAHKDNVKIDNNKVSVVFVNTTLIFRRSA